VLYADFEAFLKKEFSEENLYCYKEIWEYKKIESASKRCKVAKQICDKFFGTGSEPELITLPAEQLTQFTSAINNKSATVELFDEVMSELGSILRTKWVRFSSANDGKI
jgi:hypothetical protein